jgi:hypothetical protein
MHGITLMTAEIRFGKKLSTACTYGDSFIHVNFKLEIWSAC